VCGAKEGGGGWSGQTGDAPCRLVSGLATNVRLCSSGLASRETRWFCSVCMYVFVCVCMSVCTFVCVYVCFCIPSVGAGVGGIR